MSEELRLHSRGLTSKYGFNDGDEPDDLLDWFELHRPEYDYPTADWHPVLVKLVQDYLLPALKETVEVMLIETNHNPIRAAKINGNELVYEDDLDEVEVTVPFERVWEVIVELGMPRADLP